MNSPKKTAAQIEAQAERMVWVSNKIGAPVTLEEAKVRIISAMNAPIREEDREELEYRAHARKVDSMMTLNGRSY